MKKNYFNQIKFAALILMTVALLSCGKDGTIGPEGPQGVKGEQGINGADGSTIHNGTGAPDLTGGKVGDFYLDKITTNLYGPKTASSWGDPLNLKGTKGDSGNDGAAGAPGSKIHSGSIVPASSVGAVGDFYFDTKEVAFYGPKTNSSWGTPVSLKGADDNGVKVVVMKNYKTEGAIVHEWSSYFSVESKITPTVDYNKFYEGGAVLVYLRDPKDARGLWTDEISRDIKLDSDGSYSYTSINNEAYSFGKDGIYVKTTFDLYNGQGTAVENTDEIPSMIRAAQEDFLIDIKFVLIPGTTVNAMKQQNINIKDIKAIDRFLNL